MSNSFRSFVIMLFLFIAFATPSAWGARVPITPPPPGGTPSNAYQNATKAIDFLRSMGHEKEANALKRKLDKGELGYDFSQEDNGDTNTDGIITVRGQLMMGAASGTAIPLFDATTFDAIVSLARTFFHELVHVKHGAGYRISSNLPGKTTHEIEAWTKTIQAMMQWVINMLGDCPSDAMDRMEYFSRLQIVVLNLSTYLGAYKENTAGPNKTPYFGDLQNRQSWETLAVRLKKLLTAIGNERSALEKRKTALKIQSRCKNQCGNLEKALQQAKDLKKSLEDLKKIQDQISDLESERQKAEDAVNAAKTSADRVKAAGKLGPITNRLRDLKKQRDANPLNSANLDQQIQAADTAISQAEAALQKCRLQCIQLIYDEGFFTGTEELFPSDMQIVNGVVQYKGTPSESGFSVPDCPPPSFKEFVEDLQEVLSGLKSVSILPTDSGTYNVGFIDYDSSEYCTFWGGTIPIVTEQPGQGKPVSVSIPAEPGDNVPSSIPNNPNEPTDASKNPPVFTPENSEEKPPKPDWQPVAITQRPSVTIPVLPIPKEKKDEPESSTPDQIPPDETHPQVTLIVKASETVLEKGRQAQAIAGAHIKLDVGPPPELPFVADQKDETTGHNDEPIQGITGKDGQLALRFPLPGVTPVSDQAAKMDVDLTPRSSKIVAVQVDPAKSNSPAGYLPKDLLSYANRSWQLNNTMYIVLSYPEAQEAAVAEHVGECQNLIYSETNFCREKQELPSDAYFLSRSSWKQDYDDQWAIKRAGFTAEKSSAWNLVPNPAPVIVAVIDTGLDWNHQDLSWNSIWKNEKEIPGNNIDDDANGYRDDVIGWDFFRNTNKPWDYDGHGTFVTGVIAAAHNRIGIAGINPAAKIMVLKALNSFGHTRASFLAEAIIYAANQGARVINISVGGKNLTRTEQEAIDYAYSRGALIVAAAGNEAIDISNYGPAGANHVLVVAASNFQDQRALYSNFGAGIDLAAPGDDVLSLRARRTDLVRDIEGVKYRPGDAYVGSDRRYYRASGTSFAAPIVSGIASLIYSSNPNLNNRQIERMLLQSATDIDTPGADPHTGYGLVDARPALQADPEYYIEALISGVQVVAEGGQQKVQIQGRASANLLKRFWIELGAGEKPLQWKKVSADSAQSVTSGILGSVPAVEFRNSTVWILRLVVENANGKSREARFRLELQ